MAAEKKASLFDKEEEDDADQPSSTLKVNKKYASDYQLRKQRQELREFNFDNEDSSSSEEETEDEDGDLLVTPTMDVSILKTINALRTKDESIYDGSTRFFPQEPSSGSDSEDETKEQKHKPKRYKDVIREQILQQIEEEETGESKQQQKQESMSKLAYDQEQKELRSAFIDSTKEDDDNDDWMVVKRKTIPEEEKVTKEADRLIQEELKVLEAAKNDQNTLVDPHGEVENGQEFLLDFIKNKKWIDKTHENEDQGGDDDDDDSLDQLERTDEFESKYNFRFEDAVAAAGKEESSGAQYSMVSYARGSAADSMLLRRKDETRRLQRLQTKERKAAERKAKEEELRRLKNAKRQEMQAKLKQIKAVLGQDQDLDEATMLKLMEGDYDPDQFEEIMGKAYNDDFYQQEDAEWKTDAKVRESLISDNAMEDAAVLVKENEDGDVYDNYDEDEQNAGDQDGLAENSTFDDDDDFEAWEQQQDDGQEEETEVERKLKRKMMDELYKLDYEDIVAGMPTRFKYKNVQANNYGLSTQEILFARDATLKQYVSLKKLAPYREEGEFHVTGKRRKRFRDMVNHEIEEELEKEEAERGDEDTFNANEEAVPQTDQEPKKKKRRRQKKGKKKEKEEVGDNYGDLSEEKKEEISNSDGKEVVIEKHKTRRKKKGSKRQKRPETEAELDHVKASHADSLKEDAIVDGASPPIVRKDNSSAEATTTNENKKKKKKKRKKNKSSSVEGVSSLRLASYGL